MIEIDLGGLRAYLRAYADVTLKDSIEEEQYNKPRWIDTSAMIVDPLTKHGNDAFTSRLVKTTDMGLLDLTASAPSELRTMKAQTVRLHMILGKDLDKYQDPAVDLTEEL